MSKDKSLLKFNYKALDDTGKQVSGTEMATSTGAAHVALLARGLQPTVVENKTSLLKFEITKKKVPRQDVMNFTRQLAVFMKAGVPIMEALEVIVAEMSVVTVLVLAVFVMPRFEVFFKSLHAKLPLVTRMLLSTTSFMGTYWYAEIAAVVIVVGGLMAMQRSPGGKARLDAIKLKLPVIGDLTETAIIERTCRVLASMLRAGVDLPRSMAVTAESANNAVYRNALEKIREAMMQGQGLAEPIAQSGLFPAAARQMFRVGEETGTLDQQLEVAAAYYGRELETKLERATALFEPAIIILMGVVVGFVAVALISAMYGIYNQVKVG